MAISVAIGRSPMPPPTKNLEKEEKGKNRRGLGLKSKNAPLNEDQFVVFTDPDQLSNHENGFDRLW